MTDAKTAKKEPAVPVALRGANVMKTFRDALFDESNRCGMSPNEFCLWATFEKLQRSGRNISGLFWKGDHDGNGGLAA